MSESPHRKRFIVSAFACTWGPAATVVSQLAQVPLFLSFWGVEKYGEWLVVIGIPAIMSFADAGIAQASSSKCVMEVGAQQWKQARNTLQTARVYSTAVALMLVAAASAAAYLVDWPALLKLQNFSRHDAAVVVFFSSIYWAVMLQGGYLGVWLKGSGQMPAHAILEGSVRIVDTLAIAIALVVGASFIGVALALVLSMLLLRTAHAFCASRLASPELSHFGAASMRELREILKPGAGFIGFGIAQAVTVQGGLQILNQFATQQAVVVFSATRTFVRLIVHIGSVANNALRPELSRLIGGGLHGTASSFSRRVAIQASVLSAIAYVSFVAFGPVVIGIWTGGKVAVAHWLVALVGLHALINVMWYVPLSVSMAANRHTRFAVVYLVSALLTSVAWIACGHAIDPFVGAAALLCIPEAVVLASLSTTPAKSVTLGSAGK